MFGLIKASQDYNVFLAAHKRGESWVATLGLSLGLPVGHCTARFSLQIRKVNLFDPRLPHGFKSQT